MTARRTLPQTIPLRSAGVLLAGVLLLVLAATAHAQADTTFAARLKDVQRLQDQARFPAADSLARACLAEAIRTRGAESLEAADFMVQVAVIASAAGKDKDPAILKLVDVGLRIRRKKLPPKDLGIARALRAKAFVLLHTQGAAAAVPLLEEGLEIRKAAQGAESRDYAVALVDLGSTYVDIDRQRFRMLNEEAAAILARVAPDDRLRGSVLTNLGAAAMDRGDYAGALRYSEESVQVKLKAYGPEHPRLLVSLANVAQVRRTLGDDVGALALLEQVERSQAKALGAFHPELVVTLQNIGEIHLEMGDFETARADYERTLAIVDSTMARESIRAVQVRLGLAGVLIHLNETERARAVIRQALSIDSLLDASSGSPRRATALAHLALLTRRQGNVREAASLYGRALAIYEKILGPGDIELARTRISLADALLEMGDRERARELLAAAESALEGGALATTSVRVECQARQCVLQHLSGDDAAALALGMEAEAASREQLRLGAEALPERAALQYAANRPSSLGLLVQLAVQKGTTVPDAAGRVWDAVIRSRALVLDEMAERTRALVTTGDDEAGKERGALTAARGRLANLLLLGPGDVRPEHFAALLARTRAEAESLETAVAATSRRVREARTRRSVGLAQVTGSLSPGDALIAYAPRGFRRETGYAAFVLAPGRAPVALDIGRTTEIDSLVGRWYALASHDPSDSPSAESGCAAAARALANRIWAPLVPALSGARRIFIVPEGALNEVNFAALPGHSGYMIEDGIAIQYLSAERDLAAPAQELHGQALLAMGGIDYSKADGATAATTAGNALIGGAVHPQRFRGQLADCTALRDIRFAPLPASRREVSDIVAAWRASGRSSSLANVITGTAATEGTLKESIAGKSLLHLATHAFLEGECGGADTRGVGGLETVSAKRPEVLSSENPLRLCGLAFAGANARNDRPSDDDDGILTAEEVSSLDLTTVDWAVLSACSTGRGELISGEGLVGLRRAFQVAGAHTLITSLWPVGDESTRDWMGRLYAARLGRKETTIDAVQSADLEILQRRRARHLSTHPFYWAGFVASGDWR